MKFDKLKIMFDMQKDLQKNLLNAELPKHDSNLVSYFALGLYNEIGEVLQADKTWKPWAKNSPYNREETEKEIADCWLFLINLTLAQGIDAERLFDICLEKHNEVRGRNGLDDYEV
jgi:dimeric dUTPase (all-alpha-NTP-PPase superfamily)